MMYIAKVTTILEEIKEHKEFKNYPLKKESHDTWIEVPTEELAKELEEYNERGFIESLYYTKTVYLKKDIRTYKDTSEHFYSSHIYIIYFRPKGTLEWIIDSCYMNEDEAKDMEAYLASKYKSTYDYMLVIENVYKRKETIYR